jgi:hypothetical protein
MRRRYRQNPKTLEMELLSDNTQPRDRGILVCPDITPFKSIVDGTVITGRRALREHNKRNQVTFTEDFRGHWEHTAKERAKVYSGDPSFDRQRRVSHIVNAVEKHTRRR